MKDPANAVTCVSKLAGLDDLWKAFAEACAGRIRVGGAGTFWWMAEMINVPINSFQSIERWLAKQGAL